MAIQTRDRVGTVSEGSVVTGWRKFLLRDVASVFEIRFILMRRSWYWYTMGTLVFPMGMFYFASALAPDDPEAIRRAMIGSMVFGATMLATTMLGQSLLFDRFQHRLKLIITMPVSQRGVRVWHTVRSAASCRVRRSGF